MEQLFSYAQQDVLLSIMKGTRCIKCLSKLKASFSLTPSHLCSNCQPTQKSSSKIVPSGKENKDAVTKKPVVNNAGGKTSLFWSEKVPMSKNPSATVPEIGSKKRSRVSDLGSMAAQMQLRESLKVEGGLKQMMD